MSGSDCPECYEFGQASCVHHAGEVELDLTIDEARAALAYERGVIDDVTRDSIAAAQTYIRERYGSLMSPVAANGGKPPQGYVKAGTSKHVQHVTVQPHQSGKTEALRAHEGENDSE